VCVFHTILTLQVIVSLQSTKLFVFYTDDAVRSYEVGTGIVGPIYMSFRFQMNGLQSV
jgi:hypothetical protein